MELESVVANALNAEKEAILLGIVLIQEKKAVFILLLDQDQGLILIIHLRGVNIKEEEHQGKKEYLLLYRIVFSSSSSRSRSKSSKASSVSSSKDSGKRNKKNK